LTTEHDRPILNVYTWGEFISPDVISDFEDKYHCWVEVDVYDSNEALYAKLKAGAVGYDVIFPSHYFVDIMGKQNMLAPLDFSLIPNSALLSAEYMPGLKPTTEWSVTYMLSNTIVAYRKSALPNPKHSWTVFADPAVHKRATMLNDPREAIGAALKVLGYSLNTQNPDEINAAADLVIQWKSNLAKFDNEQFKYAIATGEQILVQGYTGMLLQVQREDSGIELFFPKEGSAMSADHMAILRESTQLELAHAFINHLLDPDIAKINMESVLELTPIPAAIEKMPKDLRENPAFLPTADLMEKNEFILDVGPALKHYNSAWDRIKAAHP
ncbi:MAG: spermidine/putrescine ABC transporter substrate-binding protein, partial [Chlamydiia bacterium]|nr:spermidine/putrescine ABC transporter substrate-binding protein [Chlamydiia bacterium]